MIVQIEAPEHAGFRDQARALIDPLPSDLSASNVVLDCAKLLVGTPSFLDELVKQVLIERRAELLCVHGASERVQQLLQRSAENRAATERLSFAVRS